MPLGLPSTLSLEPPSGGLTSLRMPMAFSGGQSKATSQFLRMFENTIHRDDASVKFLSTHTIQLQGEPFLTRVEVFSSMA